MLYVTIKGIGRLFLAGLVVSVLAVVACAPAGSSPDGSRATTTPGLPNVPTLTSGDRGQPVPTLTATPTSIGVVQKPPRGRLVVAVADVGPRLYSMSELQWPYSERNWHLGIYETLLGYENWEPTPLVAESWSVTPEGLRFKLREGVRFQDLTYGEVTAEDVVFSFEEARTEGSKWPGVELLNKDFGAPVAVDTLTVQIPFKKATIKWMNLVTLQGSPVLIQSRRYYNEKTKALAILNPMGTGPFKVVSHQPGERLSLEAVTNHWRKVPGFATVDVLVSEEDSRIALIRGGIADIIQVSLPNTAKVEDVQGVSLKRGQVGGKNSITIFLAGQYYIKFKEDGTPTGRVPLTNLPWVGDPTTRESLDIARKVRWAMSMAINREALAGIVLGKYGNAQYIVNVDTANPRWNDKWKVFFNPERAKQLLAEAGYPEGFDFEYFVPTGVSTTLEQVAEALVPMWQAIGLRPNVMREPYAMKRPAMQSRTAKEVWAFLLANTETPAAIADQMERWTDRAAWNPGLEYPEVRDMQNRALAAVDPKQSWTVIEQWLDWVHSGQFAFPVAIFQDPWAVGRNVKSWEMRVHTYRWPSNLESAEPVGN